MVNFVAILVAAVAAQIIGMLWYSPTMFGETWMKLVGLSKKDAHSGSMAPLMLVAFIGSLVMGYVLSMFMGVAGSGLLTGFYAWLGFVATVGLGSILWEKKPVQLYFLNMAYWLVSLLVMGAIIGAM